MVPPLRKRHRLCPWLDHLLLVSKLADQWLHPALGPEENQTPEPLFAISNICSRLLGMLCSCCSKTCWKIMFELWHCCQHNCSPFKPADLIRADVQCTAYYNQGNHFHIQSIYTCPILLCIATYQSAALGESGLHCIQTWYRFGKWDLRDAISLNSLPAHR